MESENVKTMQNPPPSLELKEKIIEKPPTSHKVVEKTGSTKGLGRLVMNAIRKLQGRKGAHGTTLANIKSFLNREKNVDTMQMDAEIKMYLKNALNRGQLTREAGNYKVAERARKKSSGGRKKRSVKTSSKQRSRKSVGSEATKKSGKPRAKDGKRKSSAK